LKDRIDSQIATHYPSTVDESLVITDQEAWSVRNGQPGVIPKFYREIIEEVAFVARESEFIDQSPAYRRACRSRFWKMSFPTSNGAICSPMTIPTSPASPISCGNSIHRRKGRTGV